MMILLALNHSGACLVLA